MKPDSNNPNLNEKFFLLKVWKVVNLSLGQNISFNLMGKTNWIVLKLYIQTLIFV